MNETYPVIEVIIKVTLPCFIWSINHMHSYLLRLHCTVGIIHECLFYTQVEKYIKIFPGPFPVSFTQHYSLCDKLRLKGHNP